MTKLIELVQDAAANFDQKRYSNTVYFHLLARIRSASTSDELGELLYQMLAWKDGKVRVDASGPYITVPTGVRYSIKTPKPNTFGEKHRKVIGSEEFFEWAIAVRELEYFEPQIIREMEQKFGLWTSVVIPIFVLHCLNPRVFPIIDRWVVMAFRILQPANISLPNTLTLETYAAYHAWWLGLLVEAGLSPFGSQLQQLKIIDAGLWVLGKRWAASQNESENAAEADAAPYFQPKGPLGTDSIEFKRLAISIRNSGASQRDAIVQAAREMGVELKPSYLTYPGSQFDRWRKQGLS